MQLHRPTTRDQSGFSPIEVLLIVLVIAALALTGYVFFQRHKPTSVKNNAATSKTQSTTQPTTPYLTIKEWGIKLPLSDSIKDAYYVVGTSFSNDPDGLPSGVFLGLTSLSGKSCNPSNNNNGGRGAVGAILRFLPSETDAVTGQQLTQKYPNGTTIGSYYYGYQSGINNNPCAPASILHSTDTAFAVAAKGIVSTTTTRYLTIKEWSVRAPYSGSLNLQYAVAQGVPNSLALSSSQLAAGGPAVCADTLAAEAGRLDRYLPTDANLGPKIPPNETAKQYIEQNHSVPYAKIGSYIYIYWGNSYLTNGAYEGPCNDHAAAEQTIAAYSAIVPELQAIPN
jgi:hypothetical protein